MNQNCMDIYMEIVRARSFIDIDGLLDRGYINEDDKELFLLIKKLQVKLERKRMEDNNEQIS